MFRKLRTIAIKLGIKRPPQPAQRFIPVGPISKQYFPVEGYSLRKLYGRNKVTTTKYTWYGFFFQNLGEQAQRIANFYFISLAIIQLFTDSPVSPTTSIIPLFFVLSVTMIKQGYEDFLRLKADREINHIPIEIVTENGYLTTVKSMELEVGNIILCRNNSSFPCDMVLLSSSEPSGECFVTTASLDGETNLKKFEVSGHTNTFDTPLSLASELKGYIYCQQPVEDLYTFSGRICLKNSVDDSRTKDYPLGPKNLLLRGACLRNTDYIYGCAVYTGRDTKLALNSKGKKTKFSQVEGRVNFYLFFILGFLIICVIISIILSLVLGHPNVWYIPPEKKSVWSVFQEILGFVVLYNYIIPISLYVTIEMQKFVGSLFFEWDLNLYDERINERAKANTSDLIEEMGQVEYLFTDKTGTLTENSMQFRRLATSMGVFHFEKNGLFRYTDTPTSIYGTDSDHARTPVSQGDQDDLDEISEAVQLKTITESNSQSPIVNSVQTLLLLLSLCHTVRVERSIPMELFSTSELDKLSNNDKAPRRGSSALKRRSAAIAATAAFRASKRGRKVKTQDYEYQASSPDEKAFVETCRDLGIVYHGSDESGLLVITIQGEAVRYRLLDVLEFDATRKCMSVVVQFVPKEYDPSETLNSPVLILCKGAETSLLSRIDYVETPNNFTPYGDPLGDSFCGLDALDLRMGPEQVMNQVTEFATLGLRTLVMGIRLITVEKWIELKEQLDKARSIVNEGRQKELVTAYDQIENKLTLIGCTGIEDMLQEGVPETIKALREAGIKIWVLTGDKEETAVNISYSAGHFYPGMQEIRITNFTDTVKCGSFLKSQIERIKESKVYNPDTEFGVVIDGQSLNYALVEPIRSLLTQCCLESNTVLCCRSTPLQKAEVVRLIKESHKKSIPITAAIGDGANDVSMILEAHIGFGIYGKEGRQAVRASDYAFGRFHFIKYALLIHGHNFYQRVSLLVLYFFYKNLIFTLPQMFYGFFCVYSKQSIFPEIYLILFNLIMTSMPIFVYGIFEIPITQCILLEFPILYKSIARNRLLCKERFLIWISLACWHALVAFFGAYFLTIHGQANDNGLSKLSDIICFGNFIVLIIFLIVNIKVLLISYYLNWIVILIWNLTILINIAIFLICNAIIFPTTLGKQLYGTYTIMWTGYGAGLTWFSILTLVLLALIPDLIIRTIEDQGWEWRLNNLRVELRKKQNDIKRHTKTSVRISIMSKQYDELDDIEEKDEKIYEYTNPIMNELHNLQMNDKYNYSLQNSLNMTNSQYTTTYYY
ncbi:putative phospholipid-transporting ATPase IF isoform 2 [Schistosoma japonicum]|uniref:Phospholipid-transporting ATPase n=1 Tax=Schistosoma japonicum TaxID=6182 RepID=A0A4Z2D0P5_SCHJA|nr:putative phospholipid-transporting ATPase IF isoform 2 [Schistosoma japonicum]